MSTKSPTKCCVSISVSIVSIVPLILHDPLFKISQSPHGTMLSFRLHEPAIGQSKQSHSSSLSML